VRECEQVVVAANFLIDAESNLKAAIGGLSGHSGHGSPATGSEGPIPAGSSGPAAVPHKAEGRVDAIDPKGSAPRTVVPTDPASRAADNSHSGH